MTKEEVAGIVKAYGAEFGAGEQDSGCAAVQVAVLTHRINSLKDHFEKHTLDFHSNRGLLKMIGQRKAMLKYVQRLDEKKYRALIKKLGLRK